MKHAVLTLIMVVAACVNGVCGEPADSAAIRSFEALERRAAQGDENARFRVARTLETGFGNVVKRDSLRARRLLEQGVANGYAPAQNYLGFILFNEQQPDSALNLFMAAADQGDITAYTNLGWLLLHDSGTVRDYDKALYWLRRGADKGSAAAAAMLGDMLRLGLGSAPDAKPDTVAALSAYNRALELYRQHEYRDAQALTDIGRAITALYPQPDSLATDSLLHLGTFYCGMQIPATAMRFYKTAADRGNAEAQEAVAKAYSLAQGLPYNHRESLRYYLSAALGGSRTAQRVIGELLEITPDALSELPEEETRKLSAQQRTARYWLEMAEKKP